MDGHEYLETWFVACKRYTREVPPERHGTIALGYGRAADTVLLAAELFTNEAKDWVSSFRRRGRRSG